MWSRGYVDTDWVVMFLGVLLLFILIVFFQSWELSVDWAVLIVDWADLLDYVLVE